MPAPVVEAKNINLKLRSGAAQLHVLRDVSFSLAAGEVASVAGPSGSGKTSLLMVLAGLEKATDGSIAIDGHDISGLDEDALAVFRRKSFGILFQNFHLIPSMTALENVALTMEIADPRRPYREVRQLAEAALAEVGLGERLTHLPSALSGGEQQRVGLARAMVGRPREPTGNLDQETGARVIRQMFDLARERGTTVLLITHDTNLAASADRQLTLNQGRLTEGAKA